MPGKHRKPETETLRQRAARQDAERIQQAREDGDEKMVREDVRDGRRGDLRD